VRYVTGFARFWYEFVIGDDWRIAAGVAAVLALAAVLVALTELSNDAVALLAGAAIMAVFTASVALAARSAPPAQRRNEEP
jgi:galactitol-specific phosphotransferase system IIC component